MAPGRVIGLGEPMAGDDGAGLAVVRHLRREGVPSGVELIEARDATAVLAALEGAARVVVVDAVLGGGPPGSVLALTPESLASGGVRPVSSHGVSLGESLSIARILFPDAWDRVRVVGIAIDEARPLTGGLSPAVEASIPVAAAKAVELLGLHRVTASPASAEAPLTAGGAEPRAMGPFARRKLRVRGVVQGVGFRPFIYRTARELSLEGWVRNLNGAVEIEVQGAAARLESFAARLREHPPPSAVIESIVTAEVPPRPAAGFQILESAEGLPPSPALPADLATCEECLAEMRDPADRRHRYPFTNCTRCGPRYSIVERTPYDRPRTSMRIFPLCPACEAEYRDPADRRFHAEPIACPRCGPSVRLLDPGGEERVRGDGAITAAARALAEGAIVALKGLGGFQLLADARSETAVARLRRRKRREDKPFAVMLGSLDEVRAHCQLSEDEERALVSDAAPIVLLRRRAPEIARGTAGPGIAEAVAPGNPRLGVMLPYTPLHHLLLDSVSRPLVCTSGNLSEEPMCVETDEALERLGGVADLFLVHDRPIVRPVDDSVVRIDEGEVQLLRRARGFAPRPLPLPEGGPTVLALGGHLKSVVAVALGAEAVASQHIGDLESLEARALLERTVDDLLSFFDARPDAIACDLHPDYASTLLAEHLASRHGVPLLGVQHHHAHAAAALLEHGIEGPALAFAWDGAGYGPDGTLWGGEALLAAAGGFRRVATLRPFRLPGAESAIREPRRSAVGLLHAMLGAAARPQAERWFRPAEIDPLFVSLERGVNAPWTTGMGRLFDAAAALTGGMARVGFEGQAAMDLEFALEAAGPETPYPLPLTGEDPMRADWEPLVRALLEDARCGAGRAAMGARFHGALAEMAVAVARIAGEHRVVLTGGCFQNVALTDRLRRRLREEGFEVFAHRAIPPNDGGIAFGQLLVARRRLAEGARVPRHPG